MTDTKEYILTSRTTFVIEVQHPSSWDPKSNAEQVFNAGERENRYWLDECIREQAKLNNGRRVKVISQDTDVVVIGKKK